MHRFSPAASGLFACATLLLGACSDAPTQPAVMLTPETQAAIKITSVLPTLPLLLATAQTRMAAEGGTLPGDDRAGALDHARNTWQLAELLGPTDQARALRVQAYDEAVPVLAQIMNDAELAAAQQRLLDWAALAAAVVKPNTLPDFTRLLEQGRTLAERAVQDRLAGDKPASIEATLQAADQLARTTPRGVALSLTRAAETDVELATSTSHIPADEIDRIKRLVRSAREAI
jgi:hypothetical protein